MATIKDIALLANTSQGTVSNVLNNKGNVSSDKIKRVLDAAKELNYIPNINAKNLRKGFTEKMFLILPNIESQIYLDIYKSFSINAMKYGFEINLLISENDSEKENDFLIQLIPEINSGMKVAIVTSLDYGSTYNNFPSDLFNNLIFLLRDYVNSAHFISFDYVKLGEDILSTISKSNNNRICIFSNKILTSNEIDALKAFRRQDNSEVFTIEIIQVDPFRPYRSILDALQDREFDSYIILDYEFSHIIKDILYNFTLNNGFKIYCVAPFSIFYDSSLIRYELDFGILGNEAIEQMKEKDLKIKSKLLLNIGFRNWSPKLSKRNSKLHLKLLTVDNPSAYIIQNLATKYALLTNIHIQVDIFDYNTMYRMLSNPDTLQNYDIIRCDINWLSWFAKDIYRLIQDDHPDISNLSTMLVPEIRDHYLKDDNKLFALPFSPSSQVLFYRKDLFERADLKRLYLEKYKTELKVPSSFEEYDQIAKFFTRSFNPESPTTFGMTLTKGNTGVLGSELLCRYYSFVDTVIVNDDLYIDNIALDRTLKSLSNAIKCSNPNRDNWWTDTGKEFAEGDTAMSIMFSNYAPELLSLNSKVIGKIGQSIVPGNNPLLGGGAIGISKGTNYYDESLDFITWITQETISSQASFLGNLPSNISTFNYREIIDSYPWFETSQLGISSSKCSRTRLNDKYIFNEKEFLEVLGDKTIFNSLKNNTNLDTIVESIICNIKNSNVIQKKS